MVCKSSVGILCLFLVCPLFSQTGKDWKFRKEKDGIKVYTKTVEGIKYHEYKVEAEIDGTLDRFYALFKDFEVYNDLFKDVKELNILSNTPDRHVTYLKTNTPFPARDREAVMENRFSFSSDPYQLRIDINCIDTYYQPSKKVVRINYCEGFWEASEKPSGKLFVIHRFIADPGGSIPAFIVNIKTIQNPLKTMTRVRELILSPKYQNTKSFNIFKQKIKK